MRFRAPEEMKAAEFDLTPMIDVVLLLIIFFMLSSQFARVNATPVDLPSEPGESMPEDAPPHEVVVNINASGAISLMDTPVADADLENAIKTAGAGTADFVIRADRNCLADRLNLVALTLVRLQVRSWKMAVAGDSGSPMPIGGTP